jgi:hypothetical protein
MPSQETPKLKGSSKRNPSPNSMAGGKNSARKSTDGNGSSEGGEDIFPGCRKERAGDVLWGKRPKLRWGKIPEPKVFHVDTKVFHVYTKINLSAPR